MENINTLESKSALELNLKDLVEKVVARKWLFLLSLLICLSLALIYINLSTPVYEVSTTILIDPSGKSRMLGDSRYLEGGVGLIETEKNLYNEIGIIRSYELIKQTVEELQFNISYFAENNYKEQEYYGYFPFEVELSASGTQLHNVRFYIQPLAKDSFRLSVDEKEFWVFNPETGVSHPVEHNIQFSEVYAFGEPVQHDYFHFTVKKPEYQVFLEEFEERDLFFKLTSLEDVTNTYRWVVSVEQPDLQASILRLTSQGPVIQKEIDFLNRLTENYILAKLLERDKIAVSKESFIQGQLAGVADSLAIAERKLEAFQRNAQAVDLTQSASNALNQAQSLQGNLAQLELNMKYYNAQLANLKDSSAVDKIIAPSVVGINDPLLNENLMELKRLYSEKTRLSYIKGSQSMDLEILNRHIQNATNSIEGNLRNLIQSSQLGISDVTSRINNLEGVINQLPSSEKQLLTYQRTRTLYENLFNYLSQELAKTGIAKAEDIVDTKVLDAPMMAGAGPVSPRRNLILGFAALAGLFLPLGWIILHDSIDETIQSIKEIEQYTHLPVAASIAHEDSQNSVLTSDLATWRVEESFRDLSASLQFLIPDPQQNIIGVTSTVPGEGKSYCAINLSMRFAQSGKKVLLIDLDFRKPSLIQEQGGKKRANLAKYLQNGKGAVDSLVHSHQDIPNLDYIPSNVFYGNPHELLSSPYLETLLTELKSSYAYIVIDSPALGLVSDYLLTTRYIDINLFVIRRNVSKLSYLADLVKLRKKGKMKNLYLVFNDALGKSFKYGYSEYEYGKDMRQETKQKPTLSDILKDRI